MRRPILCRGNSWHRHVQRGSLLGAAGGFPSGLPASTRLPRRLEWRQLRYLCDFAALETARRRLEDLSTDCPPSSARVDETDRIDIRGSGLRLTAADRFLGLDVNTKSTGYAVVDAAGDVLETGVLNIMLHCRTSADNSGKGRLSGGNACIVGFGREMRRQLAELKARLGPEKRWRVSVERNLITLSSGGAWRAEVVSLLSEVNAVTTLIASELFGDARPSRPHPRAVRQTAKECITFHSRLTSLHAPLEAHPRRTDISEEPRFFGGLKSSEDWASATLPPHVPADVRRAALAAAKNVSGEKRLSLWLALHRLPQHPWPMTRTNQLKPAAFDAADALAIAVHAHAEDATKNLWATREAAHLCLRVCLDGHGYDPAALSALIGPRIQTISSTSNNDVSPVPLSEADFCAVAMGGKRCRGIGDIGTASDDKLLKVAMRAGVVLRAAIWLRAEPGVFLDVARSVGDASSCGSIGEMAASESKLVAGKKGQKTLSSPSESGGFIRVPLASSAASVMQLKPPAWVVHDMTTAELRAVLRSAGVPAKSGVRRDQLLRDVFCSFQSMRPPHTA